MTEITDCVQRKVSNWNKPGGTTGMIVLGILVGLGAIYLNPILMFLNSLLANTITFIALCAVIALIAFCVLSPRIRNIIGNIYFIIMRKIEGLVVNSDPIAIVQKQIIKMKEKIADIESNIKSLNGLIIESKRRLETKKARYESDIQKLNQCVIKGKIMEEKVYQNSVVRLDGVIKRQEKRLADAEKWYELLKKLKYTAELTVKDTEFEVEERIEEWEMIKKQHKAFSSIMSVVKGKDDKFNMFTMAMDNMSYDITQKLGEMTYIIDETGGLLSEMDIDDSVTSEKAAKLLEKYEKYGIDGVLNSFKPKKELENNKIHVLSESEIEYVKQPLPYNEEKKQYVKSETKAIENQWF